MLLGIWEIFLNGLARSDPTIHSNSSISRRKLLTFFLYAGLLRTLKALELRSTKARRIDGNPRVGVALE